MILDVVVAVLAFGYGGVLLVSSGILPYPWFVGGLLIGDFYFRLWRRPVRRAQFFEDHFEISGWGVDINGRYELIQDLTKFSRPFGDFRSDTRVSFSVKDDSNLFVLPNRRNKKLGLDVYSLLRRKALDVPSPKG